MNTILKVFDFLFLSLTFSFANIIHVSTDINSIQGDIYLANIEDIVLVQPDAYL